MTAAVGSESALVKRITSERKARGWSQEQLVRELARFGCPMPQSAISRIEAPPGRKRRDVTVDEALAFSRLFGVPLLEMLVSPGAAEDVEDVTATASSREAALTLAGLLEAAAHVMRAQQ